MSKDLNLLVPKYLIHSYLYYEQDTNLISDEEFNSICKKLLDNFDEIEHPHKYLLDKESLKANTGFTIQYPSIVKHCAKIRHKEATGVDLIII